MDVTIYLETMGSRMYPDFLADVITKRSRSPTLILSEMAEGGTTDRAEGGGVQTFLLPVSQSSGRRTLFGEDDRCTARLERLQYQFAKK